MARLGSVNETRALEEYLSMAIFLPEPAANPRLNFFRTGTGRSREESVVAQSRLSPSGCHSQGSLRSLIVHSTP
jgi:hypothetical protein